MHCVVLMLPWQFICISVYIHFCFIFPICVYIALMLCLMFDFYLFIYLLLFLLQIIQIGFADRL